MIEFGGIAIKQQLCVIETRNKVRLLVDSLSGNTMLATRISTATSEIVRTLLREGESPRIEVALEGDAIQSRLCFRLVDKNPLPDFHRLAVFFDEIGSRRRIGDEHAVDAVIRLPNRVELRPHEIERLQVLVQQRSRDELVADVQARNVELQESLENLRRTRSAKERMEEELNIGREIQMSMLPVRFPAYPEREEFDVFATLQAAREVGGDFYDFFFVDENRFCVCIGDVAGKGVPAALFMAVTKTMLKMSASMSDSTAVIMSKVNTEISGENTESMFVTVFMGILDVRTGDFVYTNAGHNPPFLKRCDGSIERIGQRHGPVIGAVEGLDYTEDHLTLEPGDLLLLYTDGVTEAMNVRNELFRESRLVGALESCPSDTVESQVQNTVDAVKRFEGEAEQADDITVLAVRFRGNNR